MEAELRTGHEEYTLPYQLSRLRDWAAAQYEKEREA